MTSKEWQAMQPRSWSYEAAALARVTARQMAAFVPLIRIEPRRPRLSRPVPAAVLAAQNRPHSVTGNARRAGDLANALPLAMQDVYFHLELLIQHREPVFAQDQVGQFQPAGWINLLRR